MTPRRQLAARALVLVALAGAARADVNASVVVSAEPAALVVETDLRATLNIEVGTEVTPSVTASVGRVENVRALGGGRFTADYLPPREAYPQVAIVAVLSGERCGWTSIPLVGQGVAIARSVPGSPILVTIGEASFGPVVADARGEARVPVVVRPGVRFAYHRGKALDLKIPPTPRVHLLAARTAAPADAAQEVALFAFAVTPGGMPQPGARVKVSVTEGIVEPLAEIAPGTFAASWRLAPGRAGDAIATARLADDPAPASTAAVARPPGTPARLALEPSRTRVTAGEDALVALRIEVTDAAGNAVEAEPRVEATFGTVSVPVPAGPGRWDAKLSVPGALEPSRRSEVVARVGPLEHRVILELAPGLPEHLSLEPEATTVVADGRTQSRIRVRVSDRFGNDVSPADAPEVQATRGAQVATEGDARAGWAVRYRPGRTREAATEVLSVRTGALAASARFELLVPERRVTVAPTLGVAAAAGGLRSVYVGAQVGYWTTRFAGRLGLGGDIATFVQDRTDSAPVGARASEVHGRSRYVPVLASLRWRERLAPDQAAWASLGAGLAYVSAAVSAAGTPTQEQAGLVPALQASAAWGRRLGPGMPFCEVRLSWHADPHFDVLRGSLAVFTFALGYVHDAF